MSGSQKLHRLDKIGGRCTNHPQLYYALMLNSEICKIVDTSVKKVCGENYLFSLHWHGHPQVPSQLSQGSTTAWVILASREAIFEHRQALFANEELRKTQAKFILSSSDEFSDFIRANPITADLFNQHACWSLQPSATVDTATRSKDGFLATYLLMATEEYLAGKNLLTLNALSQNFGLNPADDPTVQFTHLFNQLEPAKPTLYRPKNNPPVPFEAPIAIYQKLDKAILVSSQPTKVLNALDKTNWFDWMQQRSLESLQVATPHQLIQAVTQNDMVGFRLMSYELLWGQDILESVTIDLETLVLNSAQGVADLSVWQVGASLLDFQDQAANPSGHDGKLVHDLQNRILNIQLQNELLARFKLTPKGTPDVVIPGRETPATERLKAICDTFSWWSAFYLGLLDDMK